MTAKKMKKLVLILILSLVIGLPALTEATNDFSSESNQLANKENLEWRIGGKIHFEEESGPDYIGINEINNIVKGVLKEFININTDSCSPNAKILLKKKAGEIELSHFVEKSRPGIGEEMHATLLYTQSRGFCSSETLKRVCENLFDKCDVAPSIENVAAKYSSIIKPEWEFKISEVVLTKSSTGNSFIIANLLFEDRPNLFMNNKPISAGLHMTLVNFDNSIQISNEIGNLLVNKINLAIKDKMIKIAKKNGMADLEFGISGSSWRIRAGERVQ